MKKLFNFQKSVYHPSYYQILPSDELYNLSKGSKGSRNVIIARFLNLSYPDYLLFVKYNFNATLFGKSGYIVPLFTDPLPFLNFLNGVLQ